MNKVDVRPALLRWARERAELPFEALVKRFPKFAQWESGKEKPTLRQLEQFANATMTPIGYLFLPEPPEEHLPIPDFRTVSNQRMTHPSPNLLEMVYICQQRQEWYRNFARSEGEEALEFVSSVQTTADVVSTAAKIRHALGFDVEERGRMPTWTDALRRFIEQADDMGIMVMCSGVVLNNNHRHLDPDEFRGFAMVDDLAPLVFINGGDTKAAQMFTLAHEIAHIWLGQSAVSDAEARLVPDHEVERWCNRVAAELLVPLDVLRAAYDKQADLRMETNRLARRFKVSTLVILRRIHDAGGLTREELGRAYDEEIERLRAFAKGSGGNFYLTQAARASKRFVRAVVVSTLEGRSSFTEAFRMIGLKKMETFHKLGHSVGLNV